MTIDGLLSVPKEFVESCQPFIYMFEDTGYTDNSEPIPVSFNYTKDIIEKYVNMFIRLYSLKVENNAGVSMSYLDYIIHHRDEYIKNYTNKNLDPPHCNELVDIYTMYDNDKSTFDEESGETPNVDDTLKEIIKLDTFFNNQRFLRGIMLCIAAFVRIGDEERVDAHLKGIMDVVQEEYNKDS